MLQAPALVSPGGCGRRIATPTLAKLSKNWATCPALRCLSLLAEAACPSIAVANIWAVAPSLQVKDINSAPSPLLITSTAQYWRGFAEVGVKQKKFHRGCRAGVKKGRNEARCAETRANAGEILDNPRPCRAVERVPRSGEHRPDRTVQGAGRVPPDYLHGGGGRDWRRHQRLQRSATGSPGEECTTDHRGGGVAAVRRTAAPTSGVQPVQVTGTVAADRAAGAPITLITYRQVEQVER